jgi:hypothetical protein
VETEALFFGFHEQDCAQNGNKVGLDRADIKSEARNPCLRRSGSAQAGEIRNNLK